MTLAASQDMLFTRRQALAAGVAQSSLDERVGVVLLRPLPTVYACFTGELTQRQRLRAAVLYGRIGGDTDVGVLGGLAACHLHGLRAAENVVQVELLLPHVRRLASTGFVTVRRSTRPGRTWRQRGLPLCSPARAVIDAARRMTAIDEVRALTAEAVQRKKCSIRQLEVELTESDSAGSRLPRAVLDEVADGVRSAAEAWLREVIEASALPQPLWNADLLDAQERWLARPDALWPEASLIAEVESREWHLSPASWAATMKRTNVLSRLGYDVQQFPPSRIRREAAGVIAELTEAYELGLLRRDASQHPAVTIRPADAGAGPTLAT